MKNLVIMIKPVSSLCNLQCKYCFYRDVSRLRNMGSFGVMSIRTMKNMLGKIEQDLAPGDHVVFAFQGGEPTLAGINYFSEFIEDVSRWDRRISVEYTLQTNGLLIDDAWGAFLSENNFLLGVSLDILSDSHNSTRIDYKGKGSYERVLKALKYLGKYRVEHNILCTLTNEIARHPQRVWKCILRMNLKFVQFTPCIAGLKDDESNKYALTPKRFASFYSALFRYWLEAYKKGEYRSIKLFDDIINQLAFRTVTACGIGGICQPQLIVEADGSVYPCDFYCLDDYNLGNIQELTPSELLSSQTVKKFQQRKYRPPLLCNTCRYEWICGGGCKRMQREVCCSENDDFCGYKEFLKVCLRDLNNIAAKELLIRNENNNR